AHREQERIRRRQAIEEKYMPQIEEVSKKIDLERVNKVKQTTDLKVTQVQIDADRLHDLPERIVLLTKRIDDVGRVKVQLNDPSLDVVAKLSLISSLDDHSDQLQIGESVKVNGESNTQEPAEKEDGAAPSVPGVPSTQKDVVIVPSMVKPEQPWLALEKKQQQIKNAVTEASAIYLPGHRKMIALNKDLDEV